jgi:hypothetical protein
MRFYTASFCSEVLRKESNSEFSGLLGYRRIGNKVHESSFSLIRASVGDNTELHVPSIGHSSINGEREMTALRSSFLCRRHRRIHEESIRQAAAHVPTLEPLAHRLSVLPRRTSYLRGMRRVHKRGRAGHSRLMREGDWRPRPSPHDHRYGALCKRPLSKSIDHTAVCLGAAPSGPTSRSRSAGRR